MSQPWISGPAIWENHRRRVLKVLLIALSLLQDKNSLREAEVDLNRELYFCILQANRQQWVIGEGFDHPPIEGKNPPCADDEERAKREDKIPDFLWGIFDHAEPDPNRSARYFVIECKRLGKPIRSDWILNSNYVQNGVLRFITEEHGYAKSEKSGAMVGYVQNMEFDSILDDVNAMAIAASIAPLTLLDSGWHIDGISKLRHLLVRSSLPSPLLLEHFWVDVRHCYGSLKP